MMDLRRDSKVDRPRKRYSASIKLAKTLDGFSSTRGQIGGEECSKTTDTFFSLQGECSTSAAMWNLRESSLFKKTYKDNLFLKRRMLRLYRPSKKLNALKKEYLKEDTILENRTREAFYRTSRVFPATQTMMFTHINQGPSLMRKSPRYLPALLACHEENKKKSRKLAFSVSREQQRRARIRLEEEPEQIDFATTHIRDILKKGENSEFLKFKKSTLERKLHKVIKNPDFSGRERNRIKKQSFLLEKLSDTS